MSALLEHKIDCHCHILDPRRYPYPAEASYRPAGQEIGPETQFLAVCDAYRVDYALLTGPNSGYGTDNSCLLDVLARGDGRFRGVAVTSLDVGRAQLADLRRRGIVGVAINTTFHGLPYYRDMRALISHLEALDMVLQLQVAGDDLVALAPQIERASVRLVIDHCGRPELANGLRQPGFVALLALGASGRASVKLSGLQKFSRQGFPYADAWPYVRALVDAYGLDQCMWGSDWPYLRATERVDYGPLLALVDRLFPAAADRAKLLWETPRRLFGFGEAAARP